MDGPIALSETALPEVVATREAQSRSHEADNSAAMVAARNARANQPNVQSTKCVSTTCWQSILERALQRVAYAFLLRECFIPCAGIFALCIVPRRSHKRRIAAVSRQTQWVNPAATKRTQGSSAEYMEYQGVLSSAPNERHARVVDCALGS